MIRFSSKIGGFLILLLALLPACRKENLQPAVYFSVFPAFGDSRTIFHFDARDPQNNTTKMEGLLVRWDWESDSVWDTPFSLDKEYVRRFDTSGLLVVTMEAMDHSGNYSFFSDTINIWSSHPETSLLLDSRDGQTYKTVKFLDHWIMSENLRYGSWIPDSVMPSQNSGPEFYLYNSDPENIKYGGLYTYYEAMNYRDKENGQGICPDGWHVPSFTEWNSLIGFPGYRTGLGGAPINIPYYFGPGSPSGLEMTFLGQGTVSYPSGGVIMHSYGLNQSVRLWTSHPLEDALRFGYADRYVATCIQLSQYSYMSQWQYISFDPFLGKDQGAIGLNYLRCIKNN